MESEIKEVVYLAISALILSVVLGFVSIMTNIQSNIAQTRNDEVASNSTMKQFKEYDKYNAKEIVGEEVIECIRMYYDSGITIYVASGSITQHVYNLEEYEKNSMYFSVKEGGPLLSWFNSSKRYRAYLVYNSEPPQNKYDKIMRKYRTQTASVSGSLSEKYNALDKSEEVPLSHSEVTGILIIDSAGL